MTNASPSAALSGHSVHYQEFSGPLPQPAILKAYEMTLPGLAERIVNAWEAQSNHRMKLEQVVIQGDNKRANWGVACATIVSLAVLGVSGMLAMNNHEAVATILAGVDIAALASVFLYATKYRSRERVEKTKIMTGQIEKRR